VQSDGIVARLYRTLIDEHFQLADRSMRNEGIDDIRPTGTTRAPRPKHERQDAVSGFHRQYVTRAKEGEEVVGRSPPPEGYCQPITRLVHPLSILGFHIFYWAHVYASFIDFILILVNYFFNLSSI